MAPITSVFFGVPADLETDEVEVTSEGIDLQDGLNVTRHTKSITVPLRRTARICDAYGIAASDAATRNNTGMIIDSASYDLEEVVSDPCIDTHPDYLDPITGEMTIPDFTKVLTIYTQHLFLQVKETIRISGKYRGRTALNTLAKKLLKTGAHIDEALIIGPSATSEPIPTPQGALSSYTVHRWPYITIAASANRVEQFNVDSCKIAAGEEWHTFECELSRTMPITDPAATATSPLKNMLKLFGTNAANWVPNAGWYGETLEPITLFTISIAFNLTAEGNATLEETITVMPTDPDDPLFDLTFT